MKRIILLLILVTVSSHIKGQQLGVQARNLSYAVLDGRVDSVWNGIDMIKGFTGKDVIIGFTDWGFDYTNPVFYDVNRTDYRILRAWDQYRHTGPAPKGYDYGTELTGKDALLQAQCDTSNVYGYGYHGTHVASIAAGAGAGTSYKGVAYEANLLFVSIAVSERAILDAFMWMYKVAQEEQKRLVVNMSWGLYYVGNMDGTGRIAQVIDSLSSLGVVFVSSAGNNGKENFHLSHTFSGENDTLKSLISFAAGGGDARWGQSVSMISSPNTSFSFRLQILNSNNEPVACSPYYNTTSGDCYIDTFLIVNASDTVFYNAFLESSNHYNNRPQVRFRLKENSYKNGLVVTAENGDFHAWNLIELSNDVGNWGGDFDDGKMSGWSSGDTRYGIGAPAHVDCVISVAAHNTRFKSSTGGYKGSGDIAYFSSYGPTIDQRMKPEVSAPGDDIISSISSFIQETISPINVKGTVDFEGRTYKFIGASGTSMSSPFVAGVVALMLQANPYLTPKQVKEILIQTAYSDEFTQKHGRERFGYGKVDAYHAVLKALETTGIANFETDKTQLAIFPNPGKEIVYISVQADFRPITLELYDIAGRQLQKQIIYSGVNILDTKSFVSGCYIIKFSDGKESWIKKWIKN
ncbi:MAG: S8 family peptidase [Bacteroidales bacterium]|jgi:subtilisin family serine protease|nr:S8 family peptidase [Bacteroidales bacterium]